MSGPERKLLELEWARIIPEERDAGETVDHGDSVAFQIISEATHILFLDGCPEKIFRIEI